MDLLEEFEPYLTKWCHEHHKPRPDINNMNKFWRMAWEDFMKTELTEQWDERKEEYANIQLLSKKDLHTNIVETEEEEPEQPEENSWEKIQKYLK